LPASSRCACTPWSTPTPPSCRQVRGSEGWVGCHARSGCRALRWMRHCRLVPAPRRARWRHLLPCPVAHAHAQVCLPPRAASAKGGMRKPCAQPHSTRMLLCCCNRQCVRSSAAGGEECVACIPHHVTRSCRSLM
jgi:hypothetical protein